MKAEHERTPWKVDAENIIYSPFDGRIAINTAYHTDMFRADQAEANAAHIVHCVNNFDALVTALQEAHDIAFKLLPKNAVRTHFSEMNALACIQKIIHETKKGAE